MKKTILKPEFKMNYSKRPTDCDKLRRDLKEFAKTRSSIPELLRKLPCKRAAVLVPIFDFDQVPHVILTKRSSKLRLHAGDVALPGGKVDPSDEDVYDSALREAEEEIGLDRKHVQVLGILPPVYSYIARMVITPVVGYIKDVHNARLVKNEDEVESVFAVPLEVFIKSAHENLTLDVKSFSSLSLFWDCQLYANTLRQAGGHNESSEFFDNLIYNNSNTFKIWGITFWILIFMSSVLFKEKYPDLENLFGDLFFQYLRKVVPKSRL